MYHVQLILDLQGLAFIQSEGKLLHSNLTKCEVPLPPQDRPTAIRTPSYLFPSFSLPHKSASAPRSSTVVEDDYYPQNNVQRPLTPNTCVNIAEAFHAGMQTEKKTNLQGKFIADDNMIVCALGDCPLPINLQTSFTLMRESGLAPGPVQLVL
jgi:hypothetical protein